MPPERPQRPVIGVMGPAACDDQIAQLASAVGRAIAERGAVLLTGGRTGVMEAASRGARDAGGLTVGILPGAAAADSPPNAFVDVAVYTGMGDRTEALKHLEDAFQERSDTMSILGVYPASQFRAGQK